MKFFFALLLMVLPAQGEDTCSRYYELDSKLQCGSNGYLQQFAIPYCEEYLERSSEFSSRSQEILQNIRQCLQNELVIKENLSCSNIAKIGVQSHYGCYLQSGFCDMEPKDQMLVIWIAREQVFNWPVFDVFLRVQRACLASSINRARQR